MESPEETGPTRLHALAARLAAGFAGLLPRFALPAFALSILALPVLSLAGQATAGGTALGPPSILGDSAYTFAVGAFTPLYRAPEPGTYELPPIRTVHDHGVVDSAGQDTTLGRVIDDRLAIVSFIYGTCSERAGCPLSTAVLHRLDDRLVADPEMARRVSLVSISFDPARDTPTRLAQMEKMRAAGSTWRFLSTCDEEALKPILDDFGQGIAKLKRPDGTWTGQFRHVLKVYLVDAKRRVRNIYSVGFLNPDLVWNDLQTLRLEEGR